MSSIGDPRPFRRGGDRPDLISKFPLLQRKYARAPKPSFVARDEGKEGRWGGEKRRGLPKEVKKNDRAGGTGPLTSC